MVSKQRVPLPRRDKKHQSQFNLNSKNSSKCFTSHCLFPVWAWDKVKRRSNIKTKRPSGPHSRCLSKINAKKKKKYFRPVISRMPETSTSISHSTTFSLKNVLKKTGQKTGGGGWHVWAEESNRRQQQNHLKRLAKQNRQRHCSKKGLLNTQYCWRAGKLWHYVVS